MEQLKKVYELSKKKFEIHMKCTNEELKECAGVTDGRYYTKDVGQPLSSMWCWTTSFVTGQAPIFYQQDHDSRYLKWANEFEKYYHNKMFETPMESMHDIGFLYCPYSVMMYKLTGDKHHREDALKAADELAKRFDIKGQYIDAWGRMDDDEREGRAIIDCMMNISLLMWAYEETNHTFYRDIAVAHAETTLKNFVREDWSIAHSFDFDRKTGKLLRENNGCGYDNGTYWARGTAWSIYGYAILARHTKGDKYKEVALNILKEYRKHINDSCIPVWDFRLPKEMPAKICGTGNEITTWDETKAENCIYNVDTSACVITACGAYELYKLTNDEELYDFVLKSVKAVCKEPYINYDENIEGLLGYQNGQMHYTTYGDYYLIELISRLLYNTETCW